MTPRVNQARQASPPGFDPTFGKSTAEIAGDIGLGTLDGLAELAADATRIDLLRVPAGMARLLRSAWQGGGGVSGLAAIFWEPGRAQIALVVDQTIDGDFRALAASPVRAVSQIGDFFGLLLVAGEPLPSASATADDALERKPGTIPPIRTLNSTG